MLNTHILRHRSIHPPLYVGEGATLTPQLETAMQFPSAAFAQVWLSVQAPAFLRLYEPQPLEATPHAPTD